CQVRLFAEGFFDAPPAWVTRDVEDRGKRMMRSNCTHLAADHFSHRLYKFKLPRAGNANRLWKYSCSTCHVTRATFFMNHCRNTEAGVVDQITLDFVGQYRELRRVQVAGAGKARNVSDAMDHQLSGFVL